MASKLIKTLSFMIAFVLVLTGVEQSIAASRSLNGLSKQELRLLPFKDSVTARNKVRKSTFLNIEASQISLIAGYLSPGFSTLGDSWELINTAQSPGARYTHGMAYDSNREVMVIFGGDPDGKGLTHLNDTWEYDGSNWSEVMPDQSPPGRVNINQSMVYDDSRGKTIIFGGLSIGRMDDTWEYNGTTWEAVTTTLSPLARDSHAMVYNQADHVSVMFGGFNPGDFYLDDTWEYNGSNWQQVGTPQSPPGRHHHSMSYDNNRGVVVLFGGIGEGGALLDDTWEYDGSTWQQITTSLSPPARSGHSMAYDAKRAVSVLFGGYDENDTPLNDTWEFDGANWTLVNTSQLPPALVETPLVYDSHRERMVLFGGGYWNGNLQTSDETWEYVGGPAGVPPIVREARADIGMPYDINRGCPSPYEGCGGSYHGFYAGVCTDLAMDAYDASTSFDIQDALIQDHLNYPGRYRYGTARYAEDLRQYFNYDQEALLHNEPYSPGDIAFFDWDSDDLIDHVSVISRIDADGRPLAMVDAPGFYSANPFGEAIEHDWSETFENHIQEHGRVITITPTLPITPTFTGQAVRIRLDTPSVSLRLWDENGKSASDTYYENFVASNVEEFIPYIPGSYYSDLDSQTIITVTNPLSQTPYFIELNALGNQTYTLNIEFIEDSTIDDTESYTQAIDSGETHLISFKVNTSNGNIIPDDSPSLSPLIGTPSSLELTGFPNTTAQIITNIQELGGLESIDGAQLTTTDLINQLDERISVQNVSMTPDIFNIDTGDSQIIMVQIDLSGISVGMYQGSLIATSNNGYPVSIPLTVYVLNHSTYLPLITK